MKLKTGIIFLILLLSANIDFAKAAAYIGKIHFQRHNVFDPSQPDWFFAAGIANSLHVVTKGYVIRDELLFKEGDEVDDDLIDESERNLRATNLFTDVKIELDSVGNDVFDVYITTQDRWTLAPSILLGTGGNNHNYGFRLEESNILGTGTKALVEALYRSENNTGWQGGLELYQRRIFQTEFLFDARLFSNRYRTDQFITINKPYRTLETPNSFGVSGSNSFGYDFLYYQDSSRKLVPTRERSASLWHSLAWNRYDRIFATGMLTLDEDKRDTITHRRAYDNTGKILLAFSSLSEIFFKFRGLNTYQVEDLPVGGWGTAVLGKIFPIGPHGDNLLYAGAQGEKSYMGDSYYVFGQITGSSGFDGSRGKYTYEEFLGLGFYFLGDKLLLGGRFRQQSVWNWEARRQLVLDNDAGLRGYRANNLVGDNRIISNLEVRYMPDFGFWILKFGGTVFYDGGTVWEQTVKLAKTRWHSSVGAGLRVFNTKGTGNTGIFRIDFAFNLDERKFGEIIFTTNQLFSVFQTHDFRLPEVYGTEFDYQ